MHNLSRLTILFFAKSILVIYTQKPVSFYSNICVILLHCLLTLFLVFKAYFIPVSNYSFLFDFPPTLNKYVKSLLYQIFITHGYYTDTPFVL